MTAEADRDDIESLPLDLIPVWRTFPITTYSAILRTGKAAATGKRYDNRDDALLDAQAVVSALRYYRKWHPELAPDDFGFRVWPSAEDGRYRWAILPAARQKGMPRANRDSRSRKGAPR